MFAMTFTMGVNVFRSAFQLSEGWFIGSQYVVVMGINAVYALLLWNGYRYYSCADYMISQSAFDAEDLPFLEEESKA